MANIGLFVLLIVVPLTAWTGFYNAVETPKMAMTMWGGSFVVCAWLLGCALGKFRFWPKSSLTIASASTLFLMALSNVWHGIPLQGRELALVYTTLALVILAMDSLFYSPIAAHLVPNFKAKLLNKVQERLSWRVVGWLSLAALLASLYAYLQHITPLGITFLGIPIGDPMDWNNPHLSRGRTISTFGNPDYWGVWLACVLPLSLSWIMSRKNKTKKILSFVAWIACAFIIIVTQTRSAWLGFGLSLIAWFILSLIYLPEERKKISLAALVAVVALGVLAIPLAKLQNETQGSEHQEYSLATRVRSLRNLQDPSLQVRFFFWRSALNTSFAHPFIGAGPNGQVEYNMLDRDLEPVYTRAASRIPESVHNEFLTVLSTAGWPAFILYLVAMCFAFNSARSIKNAYLKIGIISSCLCFFVAHVFLSATVSTLVLYVIFIALISGNIEENQFEVEELDNEIFEYNPQARLFLATSLGVILFVSLGTVLTFISLWAAGSAYRYIEEAYVVKQEHPEKVEEYLQLYDQALQKLDIAMSLAPYWHQSNYALELAVIMGEVDQVITNDELRTIWQKAREYAAVSAALAPHQVRPLQTWASILANNKETLPEAVHVMNRALALDPRNPSLLLLKTRMLIDLGRFSEAFMLVDRLDNIVPMSENKYNRVVVLYFLGRFQEGDSIAKELEKESPETKEKLERLRNKLIKLKKKAA